MDSEDEVWLERQVKHLKMDVNALKFENMMDRLDKGSGQSVSGSLSAFVVISGAFVVVFQLREFLRWKEVLMLTV